MDISYHNPNADFQQKLRELSGPRGYLADQNGLPLSADHLRSSASHQRHPRPPNLLFSEQSNGRRARADADENLQANLARAAKVVKREDVMREDLTFHVLRITPAANSANIAAEIFSQAQTTLFSKQRHLRPPNLLFF